MKRTFVLLTSILLSVNVFAASSKILMLRDNGPLRKANDSNGVEWSITVKAGTELELDSTEIFIKDLITQKEVYKDVKFYKVKYNKNIYYVQESDAEPCTSASVIQKDTLLFGRPTLYSFRNAILETGTLVVAGETTTELGNEFTRVAFYDTQDGLKRIRYVLSDSISNSDKDVKAVILLEKGKSSDNADLQKEFLDNAKSMKTTPLIADYISNEIAKIYNISLFSDDSIVSIDGFSTVITTNDGSKVNVRSLPGTAGEVIGQFDSADNPYVFVTLKTEDTQEIDGVKDNWYYVTELDSDTLETKADGIEGWVFGAFLQ